MGKQPKAAKKSSLAGNIIFYASLLILAAAIIYTFFNANDPTGSFIFGYKPQMIKSDSMVPELHVNSVILTKQVPYEGIQEMDIITFKTPGGLVCLPQGARRHRERVYNQGRQQPRGRLDLCHKGAVNNGSGFFRKKSILGFAGDDVQCAQLKRG